MFYHPCLIYGVIDRCAGTSLFARLLIWDVFSFDTGNVRLPADSSLRKCPVCSSPSANGKLGLHRIGVANASCLTTSRSGSLCQRIVLCVKLIDVHLQHWDMQACVIIGVLWICLDCHQVYPTNFLVMAESPKLWSMFGWLPTFGHANASLVVLVHYLANVGQLMDKQNL